MDWQEENTWQHSSEIPSKFYIGLDAETSKFQALFQACRSFNKLRTSLKILVDVPLSIWIIFLPHYIQKHRITFGSMAFFQATLCLINSSLMLVSLRSLILNNLKLIRNLHDLSFTAPVVKFELCMPFTQQVACGFVAVNCLIG